MTEREENPLASRLVCRDAWEIAFAEYAMDSDGRFSGLKSKILEQRFTVKDSGATHRLINHWSEMGIIDDSSRTNDQGWRKLSVVDLIWINILMELRRFGMSLEALKLAFQSTCYSSSKPEKKWPLLEFAILRCLQRNPIVIIVYEDGWCEYLFKQDYDFNTKIGFLKEKAYLVVNLNQCVGEVYTRLGSPSYEVEVDLSTIELEVIEKLRRGDLSELHLKLKDGQIQSLKKVYSGSDDYQGLIDKIEYGEYTVKKQNGKTVFTEVTEIKRVNP